MEIKVQCDCGQKFKFDVEPVNGQMPFAVNCPVCGMDGTARANVILQQLLPPAPAPAYTPPPAPAPMRPAGLSINRPQPVQHAASAAAASEDEAAEDDNEGGVHETKLGWKMWGLIILFIGLAIGGSYIKSARKSLVGDVLDWGWNKITGASSQSSNSAEAGSGMTDYKELDKIAEEEIKSENSAEARAWLAVPSHALFKTDKAEVTALMESLYKANCSKVYITGSEKLGDAFVSDSMVAVLPTDATQRQGAFKVEKEFSEKHGESGERDNGQKFISIEL